MAFAIPKIEYLNQSIPGTTVLGSGVVSGLTSTALLQAGMFVKGTGIPTGALIGSLTADSVTLASGVLATVTGAATYDFGFAVEFDYPPKEPTGEYLDAKINASESLSGVRQTSLNYIEAIRKLIFSFLSPSVYVLLDSFLRNHALQGNSFRYFEDKTLTTYTDFELSSFKITPKKIASRGENAYVWEVPLDFRRAL